MKQVLTTDKVHKRDCARYWRDAVNQSFVELDCDPVGNVSDFFGSVSNGAIGSGQLSLVTSAAQRVVRTGETIRRSASDCFLLSVQQAGRGCVVQAGREAVLQPGDFSLYDTTREYQLLFDDTFAQYVLRVPRDLALKYMPLAEDMVARPLPSNLVLGRIFRSCMMSAAAESTAADGCLDTGGDGLLGGMLQILSGAYSAYFAGDMRAASSNRTAQFSRAVDFIETNLHDPDLSPAAVAGALSISVRYLGKLFEEKGQSVARWIWHRRLEKCRGQLGDRAFAHLSASEIAFANGFSDSAHFSRAFKKKFGQSPRVHRTRSLGGSSHH